MTFPPSPPVSGLTVRPLGKRRDGLLDVVIETPANDGTSAAWAVRVRGHVLGANGPVQAVDVVVPGRVLATAPVALPTPESRGRASRRCRGRRLRLHAAHRYPWPAAAVRGAPASDAGGRLPRENRRDRRRAAAPGDRLCAAAVAVAGDVAGAHGDDAADADAGRPSRGSSSTCGLPMRYGPASTGCTC